MGKIHHWYRYIFIQSHLNLNGLIRHFMDYATRMGKNSFPDLSHPSWQKFLYEAHKRFIDEYPELCCIGEYVDKNGAPYNPYLKELEQFDWYDRFGKPPDVRIRLVAGKRHVENIMMRNNPGLAEKLFELACSLDGFMI